MDKTGFRRVALGMQGSVEQEHMGHPDFRINGKIFATIRQDGKSGMVKLTPEQQGEFIRDHPAAFAPESGAWGRSGCTRVTFAQVDEDTLGMAMTLAVQGISASRKTKADGNR